MDDQRRSNKKHKPEGFGYRMLELRALGLEPRDARHLLILLTRWKRARGIQGAIDYCSALETVLKANLNGDSPPPTSPWVRKVNGFPKKLLFLKKYSTLLKRRMVPLKRLFHVDSFTKKNVSKFIDAALLQSDRSYEELITPVQRILSLGIVRVNRNFDLPRLKTPLADTDSYPELVFLKVTGNPKGSYQEQQREVCVRILKDLQHLLTQPQLNGNVYIMKALDYFKDLPPWELLSSVLNSSSDLRDIAINAGEEHRRCVGSIYASSEPGCKLRVFASPRLIYQAALSPLFKALMRVLAVLPSDCTTDQESGAKMAQKWLAQGYMVHSVDTRSATDTTPYTLQRYLLSRLGADSEILQLFDAAVKGEWKLPKAFKIPRETITWGRGQPLGLLPSFSCYALFHNILLYGICEKLGIQDDDCFRILGDDIIIRDDLVHKEYLKCLKLMEIGISPEKSFSSTGYAEFAGYYITPSDVVRAGKFRPLSPDNVMAKIYDPAMIFPEYLVPKRLRHKLKRLEELNFPYGFRPLTDEIISNLDEDEKFNIINTLLQPYAEEVRQIAAETYKSLKFDLGIILKKGYTTEQVVCERFVDRFSSLSFLELDLFDPRLLNAYEVDITSHQYEVLNLMGRMMYHILDAPKGNAELVSENPLLADLRHDCSKMDMLKVLVQRIPVHRIPGKLDPWAFLMRIQRNEPVTSVLETPRTLRKHWSRESSPLLYY